MKILVVNQYFHPDLAATSQLLTEGRGVARSGSGHPRATRVAGAYTTGVPMVPKVGWVMARSLAPGKRNTTAFQVAAEGFRRAIPEHLIAQMVMDYCVQAGIPTEADGVLRSAAAYHTRRS